MQMINRNAINQKKNDLAEVGHLQNHADCNCPLFWKVRRALPVSESIQVLLWSFPTLFDFSSTAKADTKEQYLWN